MSKDFQMLNLAVSLMSCNKLSALVEIAIDEINKRKEQGEWEIDECRGVQNIS